jgi:hypothetical protein
MKLLDILNCSGDYYICDLKKLYVLLVCVEQLAFTTGHVAVVMSSAITFAQGVKKPIGVFVCLCV